MNKTRNKNGEGSVFQVAENKWVAKICLGTRPDGKPNIKQFSGKTESLVRKKLKEFKKSNDFKIRHIPCNDTLKAYITMWLKEYQYNKLKPLSYDRLESTINNHIIPSIGGLRVDKVTRDNIQALINKLYKGQNLSYSSIKKVYVALNSCYKHALIDDIVIKNPCVGVILPPQAENTKVVKAFSLEEVEKLKTALATNNGKETCYYRFAYLLILNTGLRMGEALALTCDNIDFSNKTIVVNSNTALTKKRNSDGEIVGGYEIAIQNSTKTINGNRVIPINNSAMESLRKLKENNNTDFVIINSKQKRVLPSNFDRSFHSILKRIGIENCGVHTLRHTFASMLFSKGIDIKIISKLLGHSTVKITYDTYVHLFDKDINRVTDILD